MSDQLKKFVYLPNAQRTPEQAAVYEQIDELGICPFCPEHLPDWHSSEIVTENEGWILTPLDFPYPHTVRHLMAIPKVHAESLQDLTPESFGDLLRVLQWAESAYNIESGGIAMRFGDPADNGASVMHLHVHLIVPEHGLSREEKVRFKIS